MSRTWYAPNPDRLENQLSGIQKDPRLKLFTKDGNDLMGLLESRVTPPDQRPAEPNASMTEAGKNAGLDQALASCRLWAEKLENNGRGICLVLVLIVATDQIVKAFLRPFWFDELFTYYLARFDMSIMVAAVARGEISNTLVGHGLTRLSSSLFGATEFGTRFPSVVAFLLAVVFLYRFVAGRYGVSCGLSSALWLCLTGAYYYGSEARSYAVVLACASIALWLWARASTSGRRSIHVILLGATLAVAIASHLYAALLLIPFWVGETVRLYERRKMDWPLVCALVLPVGSLTLHLPSMLFLSDVKGGFYSPVSWTSVAEYLIMAYLEAAPLLILACVVSLYMGRQERRIFEPQGPPVLGYSRPEWAALVTLAFLPLIAVVLGSLYTNAFVPRYVLSSIVGFSALVPAVLETRLRGTSSWRPILVFLFLLGFLGIRVIPAVRAVLQYESPEALIEKYLPLEAMGNGADPVVVASPLLFPVFAQYGPPQLQKRLVYIVDPKAAVQFTGRNTPDLSLLSVVPWSDLRIQSYESFMSQHEKFFVIYAYGDEFQWLTSKLQADGKAVSLVTQKGKYTLSQCCR